MCCISLYTVYCRFLGCVNLSISHDLIQVYILGVTIQFKAIFLYETEAADGDYGRDAVKLISRLIAENQHIFERLQ